MAGYPTFIPRAQWSAHPTPTRAANRPPKGLYRAVVVHHSAGPMSDKALGNPNAAFRQVESAALGRRNKNGEPMFAMIPYSYLLHMPSGVIGIGRGDEYGDGGTNIRKKIADRNGRRIRQGETISVCVAGNYHPGKLATDRINEHSLHSAIIAIVFRHAAKLGKGWILGRHRDFGYTECCGDDLAPVVSAMADDIYVGAPFETRNDVQWAVDAGYLPSGVAGSDPVTMTDLARAMRIMKGPE